MKKLIYLLIGISTSISAQESKAENLIKIQSSFSYKMLEPNQDLRKINVLLAEKQRPELASSKLIIGTSLISIFDYQISSIDSKFGYLMRHPTSNNQIGTEVSELVVHSFQASVYGQVNNWLSAYSEILYNPEQSFGQGTITGLNRNQLQLRKAYILIGDLKNRPFYMAVGKMDSPFGQMGSVSPFTNSTMWHAFGGLAYGGQFGVNYKGLNAVVMAVQGGAQFRGLNTAVAGTNVPSRINNFVGDINYTYKISKTEDNTNLKNSTVKIGASYMHGSAYCHEFPVVHFDPCRENNPAITAYAHLNLKEKIILKGGYAVTLNVWPGTHNPTPPLDVWEASKVSSFDIGGKYLFNQKKNIQYAISGEFSNFIAGPEGSPWERQNQYILGFSGMFKASSKLFVELFRTDGYVPLNFISGGNMGPGETHSVRNAYSNGIVIGGMITL